MLNIPALIFVVASILSAAQAAGTRQVTRRRVEVPVEAAGASSASSAASVSADISSVDSGAPLIDLNAEGPPLLGGARGGGGVQQSSRRLSANSSSDIATAADGTSVPAVHYSRHLLTGNAQAIEHLVSLYDDLNAFYIFLDPGNATFSPTALSIFARTKFADARIYFTLDGSQPTFSSSYIVYDTPYIHLDTPFGAPRSRIVRAIAVIPMIDETLRRSAEVVRHYDVEAAERKKSVAFLVPGIETNGYFLRLGVEMEAAARAQLAGGQEFADFTTKLGMGPYKKQITLLHLPTLDPDLTGFEGGFTANYNNRNYGYLVPFHNGKDFFGKLVRVDLRMMENTTLCMSKYRHEWLDEQRKPHAQGVSSDAACVTVLDLKTVHPRAAGFRKGFSGVVHNHLYGFIAAGQYDAVVRLDLQAFNISTVRVVPLGDFNRAMGGYSGGFIDGPYACFCPFKTFVGRVGGVRSDLEVDRNHLRPYHHSIFACVKHEAWTDSSHWASTIRTFDIGEFDPNLRGFSDSIRVGRYLYIAPYSPVSNMYSSKLVRVSCGDHDTNIIDYIDGVIGSGGTLRDVIVVLDLAQKNPDLIGFSGIFNSGKYLYLCPFRGKHEPRNGIRGHGVVPRVDMNIFDIEGVDVLDMTAQNRDQIPSFPEINLRGFSGCFASGHYGLYVPFYNGDFHGRIARNYLFNWGGLQELDLELYEEMPNTLKGFRGGFIGMWQGWFPTD